MNKIDRNLLTETVSYDQDTGVFIRISGARGRRKEDMTFGTINGGGYLVGMINYKMYLLHRLAFFLVYDFWPEQVDHINLNKTDNSIINLRSADSTGNNRNAGLKITSSSGLKGASWDPVNQKWRSGIKVNGKSINLGRHETPEQAHAAYCDAAHRFFGQFARVS